MEIDEASNRSAPHVLSLGSTPLDAAVLGRHRQGKPTLAITSHTAGVGSNSWRETDIESQALRDTLRLLRALLLVSRDMERSSRTLGGTPVEQEFQSKIKGVDWGKVAASCMVKSLSRKFAAQFQDPVGIASETWPDWCDVVAREFPELLPLDVRIKYFQGTAFSRSRVIHQFQEQARLLQASNRESSGSSHGQGFLPPGMRSGAGSMSIVDYTARFGTLRRRKMVLPRDNLLEAAIDAFKKAAEGATGRGTEEEVEAEEGQTAEARQRRERGGAAMEEEDEEDEGADDDEQQQEGGGAASGRAQRNSRSGRHARRMDEQDAEPYLSGEESGDDEQVHDEDDDDYAGDGIGEPRVQGSFREALLVVDFEGETGHGNGPTQEFYSLVCREVMRSGLGLWRGDTSSSAEEDEKMVEDGTRGFVQIGSGGLFPTVAPPATEGKSSGQEGDSSSHGRQKRRHDTFRFLGRFIGKALQDERLLDLPLSPVLCKILVGHPLTLHDVACVDPAVGRSLLEMQRMAATAASGSSPQSRHQLREYVESLHLDFTLPGAHGYELKPNGSEELVTPDRIGEYLDLVTKHMLVNSVQESLDALQAGIEDVFPVSALRCFGPDELHQLLCGGHEEDWRIETIGRSIVCKHGYTRSSPQIQQLVRTMANFDEEQRKQFLMFITGTPRLPIGGFSALSPNLTVVRKDVSMGVPDDYLPSCSTCQVYLKLPAYTSEVVMREKLNQAMTLGQEHFALD